MMALKFENCTRNFEEVVSKALHESLKSVSGTLHFQNQSELNFSISYLVFILENVESTSFFLFLDSEVSPENWDLDKNLQLQRPGGFVESWSLAGINYYCPGEAARNPGVGDRGVPLAKYSTTHLKAGLSRGLFLDRDGVLNTDKAYIFKFEEIEWVPGLVDLIVEANKKNFKVVVVTNQSGVARNFYSQEDVIKLHFQMNNWLLKNGATVNGWYHSFHHDEGENLLYKGRSYFRKPWPGMVLKAAFEQGIEILDSFMVGDKKK